MPDLRQLRAFLAVAQQLSFTRAAETLHLQQQSVSKTIRQLEDELGVELLERTSRAVRLTAAGKALLESGQPVVVAADAAFSRARQIGTGALGRARVGLTPAVGSTDRADILEALRSPDLAVSVAFHTVRPAELGRMLRERELDVALTRAHGADDPHLHRAELRPTPAVICVLQGHPLADHDTVTLDQLEAQRVLLPSPPGTPFTDMVLGLFAAAGIAVTPVEARVTGDSSILTELRSTDTIGLRPIRTSLPDGVVAIAVPELQLPLRLVWPAGRPSPVVHRLRAAMAPPRSRLQAGD